jgi:hypothetical protein
MGVRRGCSAPPADEQAAGEQVVAGGGSAGLAGLELRAQGLVFLFAHDRLVVGVPSDDGAVVGQEPGHAGLAEDVGDAAGLLQVASHGAQAARVPLGGDLAQGDPVEVGAHAPRDRLALGLDLGAGGLDATPGPGHAEVARPGGLLDLLIDTGDGEAAVAERRTDFEKRPIATAYREWLTTAARVGLAPGPVTEEALEILRARVARDPRYAPDLATVLVAGDRPEEAWQVALAHVDRLGEAQYVELLALRGAAHPQDVVGPYRELIERHILDSGDKRRYERALALLTPLRAAYLALGDGAGWAGYLDELRERHRIRPTFLRKLDGWQAGPRAGMNTGVTAGLPGCAPQRDR